MMLVSKQLRFLLDALNNLGGAREDQLAALLLPAFCSKRPDVAPIVTSAALKQAYTYNRPFEWEDGLVYLRGRRPEPLFLEAVDVMLELTDGAPLSYHPLTPPLLLRFAIQEQKIRLFCVTEPNPDMVGFQKTERIIQLFDGQGQARALPVSNKQFYAVKQEDGSHRFFAFDGGL